MSNFERDLVTLCMTDGAKAQGDSEAATAATQAIVNTLASVIAMLAGGDARIADTVAGIIAADLPEIVAHRAASFRERFQHPEPSGRPQ